MELNVNSGLDFCVACEHENKSNFVVVMLSHSVKVFVAYCLIFVAHLRPKSQKQSERAFGFDSNTSAFRVPWD
jgi:hypothetical protein